METVSGPVIAGLDVGSSKVATVVARKGPEGLEILGVGRAETDGMRKGAVVNVDATVKSIQQSLGEAEKMTGVSIPSVFVGVSGPLIKSFNSHAAISVRNEREVTEVDVARVLELAKAVELPNDREVLHVLTQEFIVDDMGGIKDPRGMTGIRLDARVHVVTDDVPSTRNLVKCVEKAELGIDDIALSPLASANAVLTPEEKEVGVVLLDFGAGTVEMAIFYDGALRHTFVLPLGGANITSDVAVGLKVPWADAEGLKISSGCAMIQKVRRDELVELPGVGGRQPRPIRRQYLSEIIEPRTEEIFGLLRKEILRSGFEEMLGAGVVLTGGGSLLDGLPELGERVFQLPVRRGGPIGVGGLVEVIGSPGYATAVGLAIYGSSMAEVLVAREEVAGSAGWLERVKQFLTDIF
ncbi:MAG: cell division protein FtsA [Deltaproteobacteria bacterium RBG_16_64_85]|nr:MAG: cell division protein FtsA [Deltaproteobacteria bacterium RBG_16_64_85]